MSLPRIGHRRPPTDRALIAACRRGDQDAWAELLSRYRRLIYSIPVGYRIPPGDADEIFQQVALKLFQNLGRLRGPGGLPAWLAVTARRQCQDFLRGTKRWHPLEATGDEEPAVDPPDVAARLHQVQCQHALALALERLEDTCRQLISFLYGQEPRPSYEEIAARLGRPVGSLGPTRKRCLEKLRKRYLDLGGSEP